MPELIVTYAILENGKWNSSSATVLVGVNHKDEDTAELVRKDIGRTLPEIRILKVEKVRELDSDFEGFV